MDEWVTLLVLEMHKQLKLIMTNIYINFLGRTTIKDFLNAYKSAFGSCSQE